MKKILVGIMAVAIIIFVSIYLEVTERITDSRIQERIAYWESLIDTEVPSGTRKETVEYWGKQRQLNLNWIPDKNIFRAKVDQIPVAGIRFPCSEWNVIIDIYIGNNGKSLRREVRPFGICL